MRVAMEPLVYAAGVDVFFYGELRATRIASLPALPILIQTADTGGKLQLYQVSSKLATPHAGHVHAYERSTPVFNYTVDPCGPVHITIGVCQSSRHFRP